MKKLLYINLLFTLFFADVHAQWTNDTLQNTVVRDSVGTEQTVPLSATLSDGSTYVTWYEYYNGNYDLRMQLLDPDGNKLWGWGGKTVSSYAQTSAFYHYDLKVDHFDNAIVAFQDIRIGGSLNVVAYMLDRSGNMLWGTVGVLLRDDQATGGIGPSIGVTASNNIIIAWSADSASKKWLSYQKIALDGTLLWNNGPKRIIDNSNTYKFSRASIVPADTDDFVMSFVREMGMYNNVIFAQRFDTSGQEVWANRTQVSTKQTTFSFYPEAISDLNDGLFISFNTSNPVITSLIDVYVQHVDSTGGLWSSTGVEAANSTAEHKSTPYLRFLPARSEVWVLLKVQDSGQSMSGLSVQKLDTSGSKLLGVNGQNILPISIDYYEPHGFESSADGMIILYGTGSGLINMLYTVKIDYSGASIWPLGTIAVSTVSSGKLKAQLGTFANNQVIAVWEDERNDRGIYAQNIYTDGRLGVLLAVPSITANSNFSLYPNPGTKLPLLSYPGSKNGTVMLQVTDLTGNTVCKKQVSNFQQNDILDLNYFMNENLMPGCYMIIIEDNSGRHVQKWIKE